MTEAPNQKNVKLISFYFFLTNISLAYYSSKNWKIKILLGKNVLNKTLFLNIMRHKIQMRQYFSAVLILILPVIRDKMLIIKFYNEHIFRIEI